MNFQSRQINIDYSSQQKQHVFHYAVEYVDDAGLGILSDFGYRMEMTASNHGVNFLSHVTTDDDIYNIYYENLNYWTKLSYDVADSAADADADISSLYSPDSINLATLNIYFPDYGLEKYYHDKRVKYILKVMTFIAGTPVTLISTLIDRHDVNAASCGIKKVNGNRYQECISVDIPDPWYMMYDDAWMNFRVNVCGEKLTNTPDGQAISLNNTGSLLYVELTPVIKSEADNGDVIYIKIQGVDGGHTSLYVNGTEDSVDDYIHLNLEQKDTDYNLTCSLIFNEIYNNDIKLYMEETYFIAPADIDQWITHWELVVKDSDNIYKLLSYDDTELTRTCAFSKDELGFTSWDDFVDGLQIAATCTIRLGNDDSDSDSGENIDSEMVIYSNTLDLTEEMYSMLIRVNNVTNTHIVNFDNTYLTNMIIKNFNVVNKINKTVVEVSSGESSGESALQTIRPVFIRTASAANLQLHQGINENIALNLDAYKGSVDVFHIKVEGQVFNEIGRTGAGIIFNIKGSTLPGKTTSGTYYILNENKELVTTGSYLYV